MPVCGALRCRYWVWSNLGASRETNMPKYRWEEIADTLRQRIKDGTYPPGTRLPSRRQLEREFECTDPPVGTAMRTLKQEGLVETLNGVGAYVAENLPPWPEDT